MPTWVSTHMHIRVSSWRGDQHSSQWLKPGYPTLASLFLLSCVSDVPFLKGQFTVASVSVHLVRWLVPGTHQETFTTGVTVGAMPVQPTPRSSHLPLCFLCYSMSPSYLPNINLKVLYDSKLNNPCNPHNSRKFHNYPFTEVK